MGTEEKSLRVLLYHNIPDDELENFQVQLTEIKKKWEIISPSKFEDVMSNKTRLQRDSVLITFDDGFISNRTAVQRVLNPMGIKAIFFIVSDYIHEENAWRAFCARNIQPNSLEEDIKEGCQNMRLNDLKFLLDTGHTIGAHTKTHADLSKLDQTELLKGEIVSSFQQLERLLEIKIKHFAFTFGRLKNFNKNALEISRNNFEYIHTGIRGDNKLCDKQMILRDAVNSSDASWKIFAFLNGAIDFIYRGEMRIYKNWLGRH